MKKFVLSFPADLDRELHKLSIKYQQLYNEKKIAEIPAIFEKQYILIRTSEEKLPKDYRFHKGAPLYNWGVFLLQNNEISKGLEKIILASIEDLLDYDTIPEATSAPAYTSLVINFPTSREILDSIIKKIGELLREGNVPKDPQNILDAATTPEKKKEQLDDFTDKLEKAKSEINKWIDEQGPKERRVFIGGSYKNIAVLNKISDIVQQLGFIPIMACKCRELDSYGELINDTSLILIEKCSFAIFEITFSNGHLMEIERAKDYEHLKVILIYQTLDPGHPPSITRMLMTTNFEKRHYTNFTQLVAILSVFLK